MPIPGGSGSIVTPTSGTGTGPGSLIFAPAQIEWNSALLLGDRTEFFVSALEGWDEMPSVDMGNVARSAAHGAWPGRAYAQERTVTVTFTICPEATEDDPRDTEPYRAQVRAATGISESGTESALVVRSGSGPPLLAWGQVTRRLLPMDGGYRRSVEGCALQWVCSDPRRYSLAENVVTSRAPVLSGAGGLTFPLAFPLDFGAPEVVEDATAINAGEAPSSPVITITGPASRPALTNLATGLVLEFDLTLIPDESLVIDTRDGTVTLAGGSRLGTLTANSAPVEAFVLAPGPNTLALRGTFSVPGASATIRWRDAQW